MNSQVQQAQNSASLEEEARALAIRLAQALAASSLPNEQKEAWATLIPEMRLDQLTRFAEAIELSLNKAAKEELSETLQQIQAVTEKYAAIQAQTDHDFMVGISGLVDDLRKAEGK